MAQTRRTFLQSAALTLGAMAAPRAQAPVSDIRVPRVRFAGADISRLVVGCNPFYGFAHFNDTLAAIMREYYTAERVCDVLHQCSRFGINAYNYVNIGRAPQDWQRTTAASCACCSRTSSSEPQRQRSRSPAGTAVAS